MEIQAQVYTVGNWILTYLLTGAIIESTTTCAQTVSEGKLIIQIGKTNLGEVFDEVLVFKSDDLRPSVMDG